MYNCTSVQLKTLCSCIFISSGFFTGQAYPSSAPAQPVQASAWAICAACHVCVAGQAVIPGSANPATRLAKALNVVHPTWMLVRPKLRCHRQTRPLRGMYTVSVWYTVLVPGERRRRLLAHGIRGLLCLPTLVCIALH